MIILAFCPNIAAAAKNEPEKAGGFFFANRETGSKMEAARPAAVQN